MMKAGMHNVGEEACDIRLDGSCPRGKMAEGGNYLPWGVGASGRRHYNRMVAAIPVEGGLRRCHCPTTKVT